MLRRSHSGQLVQTSFLRGCERQQDFDVNRRPRSSHVISSFSLAAHSFLLCVLQLSLAKQQIILPSSICLLCAKVNPIAVANYNPPHSLSGISWSVLVSIPHPSVWCTLFTSRHSYDLVTRLLPTAITLLYFQIRHGDQKQSLD